MTSPIRWQFAFGVTYLILLLFIWGNEVLDLPYLLLGAPQTPVNWRESLIESVFASVLGFVSYKIILKHEKRWLDAVKQLRQVASHDGLTGVMNRREFIERASMEFSRSARSGNPFIMVMIDFDNFKEVNDRYGHLCGDKVLTSFVAVARQHIRPHDLMGRLGGDEFGLVLTDANWEDAVATMRRIQTEWNGTEVLSDECQTMQASVSMGGAVWNDKDATIEDVIRRADRLLYQAKSMGRNRIEVG